MIKVLKPQHIAWTGPQCSFIIELFLAVAMTLYILRHTIEHISADF